MGKMNLEVDKREAVKQLKKEIASTTRAIQRESKKKDELWARLRAVCKHDRVLVLSEMFTADYDMGGLWEVTCGDCGCCLEVVSRVGPKEFRAKCRDEGVRVVAGGG